MTRTDGIKVFWWCGVSAVVALGAFQILTFFDLRNPGCVSDDGNWVFLVAAGLCLVVAVALVLTRERGVRMATWARAILWLGLGLLGLGLLFADFAAGFQGFGGCDAMSWP